MLFIDSGVKVIVIVKALGNFLSHGDSILMNRLVILFAVLF